MQKWTRTFWRRVTPTTLCTGQNEAQNRATHHKPELGIGLKKMSCQALSTTWQNGLSNLWVESADHNHWHFSGQTYNLHMCLRSPSSSRTCWINPITRVNTHQHIILQTDSVSDKTRFEKSWMTAFHSQRHNLRGMMYHSRCVLSPDTTKQTNPVPQIASHWIMSWLPPTNHLFAANVSKIMQHADFVCALLHHALSQFGPKEILGNSAKVSRPGRLIWAGINNEWPPLLGRMSQRVQDCPHTDGYPSSHNHGKWTMTISYLKQVCWIINVS